MLMKLLVPVERHKVGAIVDVSPRTANEYVRNGIAEFSPEADAAITRELDSKLAEASGNLKNDLKETFRSIMSGAKSNGPPSKGVSFDGDGNPADRIEHVSSPEDRNANGGDTTSFGELLKLIVTSRSLGVEDSERAYATKRLKAHYVLSDKDEDPATEAVRRSFAETSRSGLESAGGGAWAGYLVRPEYVDSLFRLADEDSLLHGHAFDIPIGRSDSIAYPAYDQYFSPDPGSTASAAGVRVFRKGEASTRQESDPKLSLIEFKITDLTGISYLSRDLIMDSYVAADAVLQTCFMSAMNARCDWEFINGDGVGKPLGFLKSPALLTVTRTDPGTVRFEDLVGMLTQFHLSRMRGAMWVASQTAIPALAAIRDTDGARVFVPNAAITQATPLSVIDRTTSTGLKYAAQGTLLGLPIKFSIDKLPPLGTTGDIALIAPDAYGSVTRQGLEIGISEHFRFDSDQIAYRFKIRNAGAPLLKGPFTAGDGAATKYSLFVKLS